MDNAGVKVTFVFAGKHKVDGNAYEPLPEDVKKRWQASIDETYSVFVSTVARNRSLDETFVRSTEALTYSAREAVTNGLADAIGPLDDAVAAFVADLSSPQDYGDDEMSKDKSAADTAASGVDIEAARADGVTAGKAEGQTEGRKAERERIGAILGCPEAKGRETLAHHMAFETDMAPDAAVAMLAKTPVQAAAAEPNAFDKAMGSVKNPKVGADAPAPEGEDAEAAQEAGNIIALYRGKKAS
jgi:ClpP class serine protease